MNHLHPDQEWYTTDVFTDYALHFMDEAFKKHSNQPIFLYIAHNAPHFPLHAREEDTKKYRGRFRDTGWDKLRQQRYERMIELGLIKKNGPSRQPTCPSGTPTTPSCAMNST